ncbi:unnamed protein product [Peronospora farinosa]|uniref:Uncharacterized protein n=1 Tax=Peronospora farinosa TaxID=134698 RepID=A0ABN8BXY2_9STRA|nr:unnamed protein product [Peronospora farinosa]
MSITSPTVPESDVTFPISARDASYWLAVASALPSSRVNTVSNVSASSSCRSLNTNSFLLNHRSSGLETGTTGISTPICETTQKRDFHVENTIFPSLYDSDFFVPRLGSTRSNRGRYHDQAAVFQDCPRITSPYTKPKCKKPIIRAEEVFEHQRYQIVVGWGSKGHLLPLDPEKYMRVVRHSIQKNRRNGRNFRSAQEQDDEILLEWSPSSTFPDILLPKASEWKKKSCCSFKQRSKSVTSDFKGSSGALHSVAGAGTFENAHEVIPRWEWFFTIYSKTITSHTWKIDRFSKSGTTKEFKWRNPVFISRQFVWKTTTSSTTEMGTLSTFTFGSE